jgi:hypothetical protein
MRKVYHVEAIWDPQADVWVSNSDLPGLVIEAATMDEFEELIRDLGPQLIVGVADLEWTARRRISLT